MAQNNKFAIENKIDENETGTPASFNGGNLPHPSSFQHSSITSPSLSARLGLTPLSGTTTGSSSSTSSSTSHITHLNLESSDLDVGNYSSMTLDGYVKHMGGTRALSRVLIANNGIAAVKAIRSIKKWAYETFSDDKVIQFVVMATPEDLRANAEYIHLADEFVHVPGGSNNNNYANIRLITEIAENTNCHAVWAGWGHASENPRLPDMLAKTKSKIVWIGPPSHAMRALGDKIGSTLIAQSAGVPCIPWSGDGLNVNYAKDGIPEDVYQKSCVTTVEEAQHHADRIGYPVMVKASEGGGGKGIRRVETSSDLPMAFRQVQGEVPGSPIFIMKLAGQCRHLEVQLLCDSWGQSIAVFGRDCSIQRRHQKIIEEGPVVAAPPEIWQQMEKSAVRLAKEVGYVGAGTVEYLYMEDGTYSFLELNPRLQVEHPVTELISGVNLPAAQLQIAMGIPLQRLPGIRRMYGETALTETKIDFDSRQAQTLPGHVIACRITAENPDEKFQPTSGVIQELNFRSTPDVWGYFSVGAQGLVHEFADSQFGHLFAFGATREIARKNMVQALREMEIRGEIRTTIEYLRVMIENEDFKQNRINTTWLEGVLANHTITAQKPSEYLAVVCGALFRAHTSAQQQENEYALALSSGHLPSSKLYSTLVQFESELIYQDTKFKLEVTKSGPNTYDLTLLTPKRSDSPSNAKNTGATGSGGGDDTSSARPTSSSSASSGDNNTTTSASSSTAGGNVGGNDNKSPITAASTPNGGANGSSGDTSGEVPPPSSLASASSLPQYNRSLIASCDIHNLSDGGFLVLLNGKKHVIHGREFPTGLRLSIDTMTCIFQHEYDPTILRSDTQGKLVQFLVENGQHVEKDQPVAELEVMKMYITIKAPESGVLHHVKGVGTVVEAGDIIATFRLDNPDCIKRAVLFDSTFPEAILVDTCAVSKVSSLFKDSELVLRRLLSGFIVNPKKAIQNLDILVSALVDKMLPVLQFDELASNAAGRVPSELLDQLVEIVDNYKASIEAYDVALAASSSATGSGRMRSVSQTSSDGSVLSLPSPVSQVKTLQGNTTTATTTQPQVPAPPGDFPVTALQQTIDNFLASSGEGEDNGVNIIAVKASLNTYGIIQHLHNYRFGNHIHAIHTLFSFIYEFLSVEETFQQLPSTNPNDTVTATPALTPINTTTMVSTEDVLHHLRKTYKDNIAKVAATARAHYQLKSRCGFISTILDRLLTRYATVLSSATVSQPLQDFTILTGFSTGNINDYKEMTTIRQEWIAILHRLAMLHHRDATILSLKSRQALVSLRLPSQKTRLYTTMKVLNAALEKRRTSLLVQQQHAQDENTGSVQSVPAAAMKTVNEDQVLSPATMSPMSTTTTTTTSMMNPAIEALVDQSQPIDDVILHFLSHPSDDIKALATEAYVRRAFQHFSIEELDVYVKPTLQQVLGGGSLADEHQHQIFGTTPELLCRFQFFMEPKGNVVNNKALQHSTMHQQQQQAMDSSTSGSSTSSLPTNLITPSPMHQTISHITTPCAAEASAALDNVAIVPAASGNEDDISRMRRVDSLAHINLGVPSSKTSATTIAQQHQYQQHTTRSELFSPREDFDDVSDTDSDDDGDDEKFIVPVTATGLLLEQSPSTMAFSPTSPDGSPTPTPTTISPQSSSILSQQQQQQQHSTTPSTMTNNGLKTVKPIKRLGVLAHFSSLDTLRSSFSTVLAAFTTAPNNPHLSRSFRQHSPLHVLYIYITSATNETVQSLSQELEPILNAYGPLLTQYKVRRITFITPLHRHGGNAGASSSAAAAGAGGATTLSYNLHPTATTPSFGGFPQLSLPTPLSITNRLSNSKSAGVSGTNNDDGDGDQQSLLQQQASDLFLSNSIVVQPSYVTFRATTQRVQDVHGNDTIVYLEDKYIRQIEPNNALHLQLDRLDNYDYQLVPTTNRMVHLFAAIPHKKSNATPTTGTNAAPATSTAGGAGDLKTGVSGSTATGAANAKTVGAKPAPATAPATSRPQYDGRRFFARVLVRRLNSIQRSRILNGKVVLDTNANGEIDVTVPTIGTADAHPETEVAFVEALNSLEIAITAASAIPSSAGSPKTTPSANTSAVSNSVGGGNGTEEVEILKRPGGNGKWLYNHIFVNVLVDVNVDNTNPHDTTAATQQQQQQKFLGGLPLGNDEGPLTSSTIINVEYVDSIIRSLTRRYADKIRRLHVTHVEFALTLRVMSVNTTTSIPIRFICQNPSGANLHIRAYYEQYDNVTKKVLLCPIIPRSRSNMTLRRFHPSIFTDGKMIPAHVLSPSSSAAAAAAVAVGPQTGSYDDADAPYDTVFPYQRQRLIAQSLDTVWCYDYIEIIDKAIRKSWRTVLLSFITSLVDIAFDHSPTVQQQWGITAQHQQYMIEILLGVLSLMFNYRHMTLSTAHTILHVLIQAPLHNFRSAGIALILAGNLSSIPQEQLLQHCNEHDMQMMQHIHKVLPLLPPSVHQLLSEFAQTAIRIPDAFIKATELVLQPNPHYTDSATTAGDVNTPEQHLHNVFQNGYVNYSSKYILTPVDRQPGQNKHAMVAWDVVLSTPETLQFQLDLSIQPYGSCTREMVLISNDITLEAGSFGVQEDMIFDLASKRARGKGIPRIYLAANSGARIGLADEVKGKYKVAFIPGDQEYTKGFEYLYLTEKTYQDLKSSVVCHPITIEETGEKRYVITDIIGKKDCLGVENLRGSGQIAGETSVAYNDIFTLTYVNCRSVGIGAYLARLGQRVIQKADPAMPLLLTGYQALNKLLGRSVYTSNVQLGGPEIMYTNGVTHQVVYNDLEGCYNIIQWLSYVPVSRQTTHRPMLTRTIDPVNRVPTFIPASKNALYDARQLLIGTTQRSPVLSLLQRFAPKDTTREDTLQIASLLTSPSEAAAVAASKAITSTTDDTKEKDHIASISITPDEHTPLTGLFDKYSFMEVLGGWAKGVITGRARLGGVPVGVVCVDTRTIEQTLPADPATADTKETIIARAGQVWFPDSSFKTAQAIKDMKAEDLPVVILANWRGFSGGMHDMLNEILKFGSYIVDALADIQQPVIVYLPPYSTLRGGAWVVIDETINHDFMEMYSDTTARGGVLEPDGIVDVKFRKDQIMNEIRRCDPMIIQYLQALTICQASNDQVEMARIQALIKQREQLLFPMYLQLATHIADLHDTPVRMKHKGCLKEIVEWATSRQRFYYRINARQIEHQLVYTILEQFTGVDSNTNCRVINNVKNNSTDSPYYKTILSYIRQQQSALGIEVIPSSTDIYPPSQQQEQEQNGTTAVSSILQLIRGVLQLWLYQYMKTSSSSTSTSTASSKMILAPSSSTSLEHDQIFMEFIHNQAQQEEGNGFMTVFFPQKLTELKKFAKQQQLLALTAGLSSDELAELLAVLRQ